VILIVEYEWLGSWFCKKNACGYKDWSAFGKNDIVLSMENNVEDITT